MKDKFEDQNRWPEILDCLEVCDEFIFKGFSSIVESKCSLTILVRKSDKLNIVICSQLKDYYGTSVTNAAEIIREDLINLKKISKNSKWFEHYPTGVGLLEHTYSLVPVEFDENGSPSWGRTVSWEALADHLGIPKEALAIGYGDELAEVA